MTPRTVQSGHNDWTFQSSAPRSPMSASMSSKQLVRFSMVCNRSLIWRSPRILDRRVSVGGRNFATEPSPMLAGIQRRGEFALERARTTAPSSPIR